MRARLVSFSEIESKCLSLLPQDYLGRSACTIQKDIDSVHRKLEKYQKQLGRLQEEQRASIGEYGE
jgi:hypothetical protein